MFDVLSLGFFQNAIMAGILASVACGIIGSLVVVNRQVFLAGGVAHAAYGGIGLAFFFGLPLLPTAIAFTALAALVIAYFTFDRQNRSDSFIGVLWASGMALGIILLNLTPGYNVDLMSYLFGSILTVPSGDLWVMLVLDLLILAIVYRWYGDFLSLSFDMEYARASGVPVRFLHSLMLVMVAVAVVLIIQVVGLILVIALLTIPPMLAESDARSLSRVMGISILYCMAFCLLGLVAAYQFDLSSGAAIIAVAALSFFVIQCVRRLRR